MFKSKVENKQERSVFIGTFSGKPIRRDEVEDPERPGHARASLFPCEPDAWNALGFYRLLANGKQSWPVEQVPDPNEPTRAEAPTELRQALRAAQDAVDTHRVKISECHNLIYAAELDLRRGSETQNKAVYNRAVAAGAAAQEQLRIAVMEEALFRKRYSDAEQRVKEWIDDERLLRRA